MKLRFLTAGESHGQALIAIIEGLPAGLPLSPSQIDRELSRRQRGFGRSERMTIEHDQAEIISGVRHGFTLGSPLALLVRNRDWEDWRTRMSPDPVSGAQVDPLTVPRPGHADLAGALKYAHRDLRNVLERASARETAVRCAAGAVARALLAQFGVEILSHVIQVGPLTTHVRLEEAGPGLREKIEESPVRCADQAATAAMVELIGRAAADGDTLGGVFEVVAWGVPPGLGSYVHWDRRLDGKLAGSLLAVNGVKAVEVGLGFGVASLPGSGIHDEIVCDPGSGRFSAFSRRSNRAGGIEGGTSTGEPIVLRAAMKPLPTLQKPLRSVDIDTRESSPAHRERADVCAVPAAAVVGEAVIALELASAFLEKFGGDSLAEMQRNVAGYLDQIRRF